jgi:ribosomal-protein-alanine N-acetyltransferase
VQLLTEWAFEVLAIGRLAAIVEVDNLRSAAVLERCGFIQEGRLRRHTLQRDGVRVDTLLYSLLPSDLQRPTPPRAR